MLRLRLGNDVRESDAPPAPATVRPESGDEPGVDDDVAHETVDIVQLQQQRLERAELRT